MIDEERVWQRTYAAHCGYWIRYIYAAPGSDRPSGNDIRILRHGPNDPWIIRWGSTNDRHTMPGDTPLEEVKAVAIALWRME